MSENTENTENNRPRKKRGGLFILVIVAFALFLLGRNGPVDTVNCTPQIIANKPDVIMLGAWWCSYCYKAKRYFQKQNINYCEYDMENTEQGKLLYQQNGGGAIPIMLIGKYTLRGFSEQQIDTALMRLKEPSAATAQ